MFHIYYFPSIHLHSISVSLHEVSWFRRWAKSFQSPCHGTHSNITFCPHFTQKQSPTITSWWWQLQVQVSSSSATRHSTAPNPSTTSHEVNPGPTMEVNTGLFVVAVPPSEPCRCYEYEKSTGSLSMPYHMWCLGNIFLKSIYNVKCHIVSQEINKWLHNRCPTCRMRTERLCFNDIYSLEAIAKGKCQNPRHNILPISGISCGEWTIEVCPAILTQPHFYFLGMSTKSYIYLANSYDCRIK